MDLSPPSAVITCPVCEEAHPYYLVQHFKCQGCSTLLVLTIDTSGAMTVQVADAT